MTDVLVDSRLIARVQALLLYGDTDNGQERLDVVKELRALDAKPVEPVAFTFGDWHRVSSVDEMQAFYLSRMPAIRDAAKECGYAVGLHGSLRRDLDLIAVPWVGDNEPASKDELAHAIQHAACGLSREGPYAWEEKPWGRQATAFPICTTAWYDMVSAGHVDLSVMPKRGKGCETELGIGLAKAIGVASATPNIANDLNQAQKRIAELEANLALAINSGIDSLEKQDKQIAALTAENEKLRATCSANQ